MSETIKRYRKLAADVGSGALHQSLADAIGNPDRVWCRSCGNSQKVDAAHALRRGWPKCCGYTMTTDHPSTWKNS